MSDWLEHYKMFVSNDHSYGPFTSTSPKKFLEVQGILSNSENFNDKLNSDDREEKDKITSEILDEDEDNKKEPCYALLENKEDNLDTDETGKENKNSSEIVGEGKNREELDVDMFKKPLSVDEGWERECIIREGEISQVYYLSPTMADGRRRRFKNRDCLGRFLRTMKSGLLEMNFSFNRKFLRLDGEFEREAKAALSFSYQTPAIFYYWKEFQDEEGSFPRRRKGTCSLCENYGEETVTVLRARFLRHMINFHLPDESCEICGREIPAKVFRNHWEYCDGDVVRNVIDNKHLTLYQKYFEEIPSSKDLEDTRSRIGRCKLCCGMFSAGNFHRHIRRNHKEGGVCFKSDQAEDFYPDTLDQERSKSSVLCPTDKNTIGMERQTKIPRVFNVETKPSYVQMRMSFNGKSAMSKIIRLQSDTTVLRAMRKFSKLVKESVRKLRFSSEGIEVVGNELARDMEGADILVESRRRNGIL